MLLVNLSSIEEQVGQFGKNKGLSMKVECFCYMLMYGTLVIVSIGPSYAWTKRLGCTFHWLLVISLATSFQVVLYNSDMDLIIVSIDVV